MQRLNKRVESKKDEILAEIKKGYKVGAVAKVFDMDTRTVKKALARWEEERIKEETIASLKKAQKVIESL